MAALSSVSMSRTVSPPPVAAATPKLVPTEPLLTLSPTLVPVAPLEALPPRLRTENSAPMSCEFEWVTSAMRTLMSTWGVGRSSSSRIDLSPSGPSQFFGLVMTSSELVSSSATT
jgi:hypothetical protein